MTSLFLSLLHYWIISLFVPCSLWIYFFSFVYNSIRALSKTVNFASPWHRMYMYYEISNSIVTCGRHDSENGPHGPSPLCNQSPPLWVWVALWIWWDNIPVIILHVRADLKIGRLSVWAYSNHMSLWKCRGFPNWWQKNRPERFKAWKGLNVMLTVQR